MQSEIEIYDEDILYAEKILLNDGQCFDDERRVFIKDLTTLDVQAVPGSGKTTALLAKLLIIERKMPLVSNSGVLVISHTNAAVNEIKSKIGKYAPKLFQYPNFVGTIQSFVNHFLAIPFYQNHFKKKTYRIDNEIYYEQLEKLLYKRKYYTLNAYLKNKRDGFDFLKSIRWNDNFELIDGLNGNPLKLKSTTASYKSINDIKFELLEMGYLHYDDSYFLADWYLEDYSNIRKIIQIRFKHVFVDEMQDLDLHQSRILENIFYSKDSISLFQRIGDINQAIYNGYQIHVDEVWNTRDKILHINGSHRLNKRIASVVELLGLTPCPVSGLKKNSDCSEIDIKPHIIVFDDISRETVISKYAEIIKDLELKSFIPIESQRLYKAVAWRKKHDSDVKLGLTDYWSDYTSVDIKTKNDYQVLYDYIVFYNNENKTLGVIRKQILNAFLKILRLEKIKNNENRNYTKKQLLKYIKKNHYTEYNELNLNLYKWSIDRLNSKIEQVYKSIQNYIPQILKIFDKEILNSRDFINNKPEMELVPDIRNESILSNIYEKDGVQVHIGTVHSVKGQTHTATLYCETFYERGYGNYESERLRNQFSGINVCETLKNLKSGGSKVKQTAKMAYVGFSRPTHLLCFAEIVDVYQQTELTP